MLIAATKAGRVATEASKGAGAIVHLVEQKYSPRSGFGYLHDGWNSALCGAKPSKKRGNGWVSTAGEITCKKCLKALQTFSLG